MTSMVQVMHDCNGEVQREMNSLRARIRGLRRIIRARETKISSQQEMIDKKDAKVSM